MNQNEDQPVRAPKAGPAAVHAEFDRAQHAADAAYAASDGSAEAARQWSAAITAAQAEAREAMGRLAAGAHQDADLEAGQ